MRLVISTPWNSNAQSKVVRYLKRRQCRRRLTYLVALRAQQETREAPIDLVVLYQQDIFFRHLSLPASLDSKSWIVGHLRFQFTCCAKTPRAQRKRPLSFRPRGIATRRVRLFAFYNVFHGGEICLRSLAFTR